MLGKASCSKQRNQVKVFKAHLSMGLFFLSTYTLLCIKS